MRIGELADRAGVTPRTLRYYEARGLLTATRDENGYRSYTAGDLRLLEQIRVLQSFGFDLEETRPFADCLRAGYSTGDECPAAREVYRRKLADLERCIAELEEVRDQVRERLARSEAAAAERAKSAPRVVDVGLRARVGRDAPGPDGCCGPCQ